MKKLLKIIKDCKGAENFPYSPNIKAFSKGQSVEVEAGLAEYFVATGYADYITADITKTKEYEKKVINRRGRTKKLDT